MPDMMTFRALCVTASWKTLCATQVRSVIFPLNHMSYRTNGKYHRAHVRGAQSMAGALEYEVKNKLGSWLSQQGLGVQA